jgi:carbonic anhydrase
MSVKKILLPIAAITTLWAGSHTAQCSHVAHWGYKGIIGPQYWGDLSSEFRMCKEGKNQSPINIDTAAAYETNLPPLRFSYDKETLEEINNGHSVQINVAPGNYVHIDGKDFELKQFHFHTPSENMINGEHFPFEAHFVHLDKDGNIAVVAVMFRYGKENEALKKFWAELPVHEGEKHPVVMSSETVEALLPKNKEYYRFNGSLTTPPCSEGVRWFVMKTPLEISKEQVAVFEKAMNGPNNRPVLPLNARTVLK